MYSEKLKAEKLNFNSKGETVVGVGIGKDEILNIIDTFCKKEDVIGVPTPKLFGLFDDFCKEFGYPQISHLTLGRIFREHFNLTRHRVRDGEKIWWVYIEK